MTNDALLGRVYEITAAPNLYVGPFTIVAIVGDVVTVHDERRRVRDVASRRVLLAAIRRGAIVESDRPPFSLPPTRKAARR